MPSPEVARQTSQERILDNKFLSVLSPEIDGFVKDDFLDTFGTDEAKLEAAVTLQRLEDEGCLEYVPENKRYWLTIDGVNRACEYLDAPVLD